MYSFCATEDPLSGWTAPWQVLPEHEATPRCTPSPGAAAGACAAASCAPAASWQTSAPASAANRIPVIAPHATAKSLDGKAKRADRKMQWIAWCFPNARASAILKTRNLLNLREFHRTEGRTLQRGP